MFGVEVAMKKKNTVADAESEEVRGYAFCVAVYSTKKTGVEAVVMMMRR